MAETTERKSNGNSVDPEAKFKRLQEIGLSMVLAIPVALVAGETFGIVRVIIIQVCILLFYGGEACFVIGHDKRQEIRNEKDSDRPKCP